MGAVFHLSHTPSLSEGGAKFAVIQSLKYQQPNPSTNHIRTEIHRGSPVSLGKQSHIT
jgi:hypothetical protein